MVATFMQVSATGYSQNISISGKDISLKKVFDAIKSQAGYVFFYDADLIRKAKPVTIEIENAPVEKVLAAAFKEQPLTWSIANKTITIVKKQNVEKLPAVVPPPIDIHGMVTDEEGKPLSGVSVTLKGSTKGTSTNAKGEYILNNLDENGTLIFSMVGYGNRSVEVKGRQIINVVLEVKLDKQDEVVVVGYGSTLRKDLTGAVSSIDGDELNKSPNSLFDASLTGRMTGVQVVKSSGAPGAVASIRIRGGTSAIGNNEPLYVIDGIPVEVGNGFGNSAYQDDYRNKIPPIANLNPEDIASIDVLKDASSAAIYGSRGANGVVIITTKSGSRTGRPTINLSYHTTFDNFSNLKYNMLNAGQYRDIVQTAYENAGNPLPSNFIAYPNANTDWVGLTTHTAMSNDVYLNVSGGTKDGTTLYSLSGGLTKQNGVIRFTDFDRKNIRTSLETILFRKVRFGTKLNYSATENLGSGTGQFYTIMKYRPDVPLYDSAGNYGASPDSVLSNPYARISQLSEIKNKGFMMSFFGEIELLKGLKLRSTISSNQNDGTNVRYTPSTDVFEIRNGRHGSRNDYTYSSTSTIFDNTLTFNRGFGKNFLNLLGGASFTKVTNNYTTISSTNFQDDNVLNNLGSAGSIQTYGSGGGISGLTSYFLRTNYIYNNKYYLTFTGRADHSTKFGPDHRWGFFPSGALAWKISNEDFLKDIKDIDELKLRVSYGKTGSANFSDFQYATFFGSGSFYNNNNGVTANTIPNPEIRWESTYQFDAAIDYSLFNKRIYGSLGYFNKITRDMILNRQIIRETGGTNQYANMGDFLNRGWEFQLSGELITTKTFTYITDVNITKYRSKVLKLNGGSYLNLEEGQPIGYFDGYQVAGIIKNQKEIDELNAASPNGYYQSRNTKPGDFKFMDLNGDGFIGEEDISVIGKSEPDFYGGWNNVMRYKNLELSVFFNFSVGNSLYNQAKRDLVFFTSNTNNYSTLLLNAWSDNNKNATLPRIVQNDPNNNRRDSDFFIEDASYFKLKNVQLSYLFDQDILKKLFISSIRAYATFSNVFTWTKYSGLDPEVNSAPSNNFSQGIDNNIYPQTKSITLGVDIKF
jgi:TonB-linked SusC/RagA family outer membrane protein